MAAWRAGRHLPGLLLAPWHSPTLPAPQRAQRQCLTSAGWAGTASCHTTSRPGTRGTLSRGPHSSLWYTSTRGTCVCRAGGQAGERPRVWDWQGFSGAGKARRCCWLAGTPARPARPAAAHLVTLGRRVRAALVRNALEIHRLGAAHHRGAGDQHLHGRTAVPGGGGLQGQRGTQRGRYRRPAAPACSGPAASHPRPTCLGLAALDAARQRLRGEASKYHSVHGADARARQLRARGGGGVRA